MLVTLKGMSTEAIFSRQSELVCPMLVTLMSVMLKLVSTPISNGITTSAASPHEAMETHAPPSDTV